ncbi:MAG: DUF327 family protein [Geobacter sp.]|nr:DUF327 family protein [Geobacter sp.]
MRVGTKHDLQDIRKGQNAAVNKKSTDSLFSLFAGELKAREQEQAGHDQSITGLREELDTLGKLLEQDPTIQNFKRFRELLSRIVKQVSNEAYRLEKIGGTPTNPRYYEIVTVIDKEADKLYELIVREQKDRMAITASVIGIKGLVIDLVT